VTKLPSQGYTRQRAARLALRQTERAVLEITRELGEDLVKRPVFRDRPDLDMTITDVESLLGLWITTRLKHAARLRSLDYIRYAREDGHSWQEIAEALGLDGSADSGVGAAAAAYEYATGGAQTGWSSFAWVCLTCHDTVLDRGPEADHPADSEPGHGDGCARLAAAVAAWDAGWGDEDSQ
jgi:hypothetical protein